MTSLRSALASPAPGPMSSHCSLLLKLFEGQTGAMHLGRMNKGPEAGRLVLLRHLQPADVDASALDIDLARSVAHPRLLKLLGVVQCDGADYVAGEYVPGAALTELRGALRKQRRVVPAPVAVRIVLDALRASLAARSSWRRMAGHEVGTLFHPDSIWIAEYGEALLAPFPQPALSHQRTPYTSSAANTAPGLVMELATGLSPAQLLGDGLRTRLPSELAACLTAALREHSTAGSDTESLLCESLSALPTSLVASDQELAAELELVLGGRLHGRRVLTSLEAARDGEPLTDDDATVVVRSSAQRQSMAADEPTQAIRLDSLECLETLEREHDPDAVTQRSRYSAEPSALPFAPSAANRQALGWAVVSMLLVLVLLFVFAR